MVYLQELESLTSPDYVIPVSYTHLDVYKRQVDGRRRAESVAHGGHGPDQALSRVLVDERALGFQGLGRQPGLP